jgi:hypothetical protein
MKRLLGVTFLILFLPSLVFATGSCVQTNKELIAIDGRTQRIYFTLTCTGDAGGIAAYTFTSATSGVRGWYLYNVTTNPGASAPTDNYDITILSDGEDISGGKLVDRSTSATQTVVIAPATLGYHMEDLPLIITFANETANPATIVITLRFTTN